MARRMKRKFVMFLLAFVLIGQLQIIHPKASYEYEITAYDVNVEVGLDNVLHVEENITVNFNMMKHGIYRTIPLHNKVQRADGSKNYQNAKVSNIKCSAKSSYSNEKGNCKVKIGDPDRYVNGTQNYTLSYDYDLGADKLKNADEFYYNIIGTGWDDTTISNVSFEIKMPKKIDQSKLGASKGRLGTVNPDDITIGMSDDTTIYGYYYETLMPNEALTVRVTMEEGYFARQKGVNWQFILVLGGSILGALLAFILWYMVGRDDPVVESVEFQPPEGRNCAEMAFLYKGEVANPDIVPLLLNLANKGYIQINEIDDQGVFTKTGSFEIVRLKPYDGDNKVERMYMNGLFELDTTVRKTDLKDRFYKTLNEIRTEINSKENRQMIFNKNSLNKNWILYVWMVVLLLGTGTIPIYEYLGELIPSIFIQLFPVIAIIVFINLVMTGSLMNILFGVIWAGGFGGAPFAMLILPAMKSDPTYIIEYVVAIVASGIMAFFANFMTKRTPYGTKILGQILGFKKFLEISEKDRLEMLVAENPTYYYDILPYAYIFDINKKWMEKFQGIAYEAPDWYHSNHAFNAMTFNHFMSSTMTSATSSMSSSPSSGGSGGGSSGGGCGGGGGGSW